MFNEFRLAFIALIRKKETLIWCFIFPLVLATIFGALFSSLDSIQENLKLRFAVVESSNATFNEFVDKLQDEKGSGLTFQIDRVANIEQAKQLAEKTAEIFHLI